MNMQRCCLSRYLAAKRTRRMWKKLASFFLCLNFGRYASGATRFHVPIVEKSSCRHGPKLEYISQNRTPVPVTIGFSRGFRSGDGSIGQDSFVWRYA